jgi:hypothetical protein
MTELDLGRNDRVRPIARHGESSSGGRDLRAILSFVHSRSQMPHDLNVFGRSTSNDPKKELQMKKFILSVALATTVTGATAFAHENSQYRDEVRPAAYVEGRESLERHINHLNRMLEHVRSQTRRYHASWRLRREIEDISREVSRVNWRFRHNSFHRSGLRREVDRLHERLHSIEEQLHVRSRDYYRWD